MKIPRHLKAAYVAARKAGWSIRWTKNSHVKWSAPDGTTVITSGTPSCYRGTKNERARLKRAGLDFQ